MTEIYDWIKNILTYMIINTIVMNLLGNKSYKKYVSIVSGMILVLIVISPIIKMMKMEENLDYYLQANEFSVESSNFKNDLAHMEEVQSNAIFSQYKEKICSQVETLLLEEMVYLKSFKVTIDQNQKSSTFGEIIKMEILADVGSDGSENNSGILTIENIGVAKINAQEASADAEQTVPSPLEIKLKNKLADFYNIEQGNINISIQGE